MIIEGISQFIKEGIPFMEPLRGLDAYDDLNLYPSRLTFTLEGAGKGAIGNYVRQRLLHPVHSWAMRVLSRLTCDGTFRQEAPIHRLSALRPMDVCSYDLSSATDRWPVSVITTVMSMIFGKIAGECIVFGTLSLSIFTVGPPLVKRENFIYFNAGQPLGYYGSWALFSLSHHYMVWLAAWIVDPLRRVPFKSDALLGDDIVIADRAVAERYRDLLRMIGVSVSESKSIDSKTGALEFAKQGE